MTVSEEEEEERVQNEEKLDGVLGREEDESERKGNLGRKE